MDKCSHDIPADQYCHLCVVPIPVVLSKLWESEAVAQAYEWCADLMDRVTTTKLNDLAADRLREEQGMPELLFPHEAAELMRKKAKEVRNE